MQYIALGWLVYRLTHSSLLLGVVGFVGQFPAFFIAPFAGVVADRCNRHKALLIIQIVAMLQATVLSVLVLSDHITIGWVIGLSICLGLINAFDMPIRQSFTYEMLDNKDDLGNAIALNSFMVNMAKLIGPSLAGIIIAVAGEKACFSLNAVSYLAVIAALSRMRVESAPKPTGEFNAFAHFKEGFNYIFHFLPIRYILLLLSLVSFMGVPYQVLMPIFAKDIFRGGPQTLGFLMGSAGAGALLGAFYLAGRRSVLGLGKRITLASAVFGSGLIAFSLCSVLWLAMIFAFTAGLGMMVQMSASNIVLQTIVDEQKRGRTMSFFTMSFLGTVPFGNLFAGLAAEKIGAPATLFIGGVICLLGAIWFRTKLPVIKEIVRPIYVEKGILPRLVEIAV